MYHQFKVFSTALLAVLLTVGISNAQVLNLLPNGDFETPAGASWGTAVGGGAPDPVITFPASGGNLGGHAAIDSTAGGWGVLIAADDTPISLASLGFSAGDTIDVNWDMIDLGAGQGGASSGTGGFKMESWSGGGLISDTGDVLFSVGTSWTNFDLAYTIDPAADALKFVPLSTSGGNIGFDNVGYLTAIPEPGSVGLIALGMIGLVARRRRR